MQIDPDKRGGLVQTQLETSQTSFMFLKLLKHCLSLFRRKKKAVVLGYVYFTPINTYSCLILDYHRYCGKNKTD